MASGSYAQWSPCNNPLPNLTEEQNKLAGLQNLAERSDADSHKALTLFEALNPPLIPLIKNFFQKFIKAFVKST